MNSVYVHIQLLKFDNIDVIQKVKKLKLKQKQ